MKTRSSGNIGFFDILWMAVKSTPSCPALFLVKHTYVKLFCIGSIYQKRLTKKSLKWVFVYIHVFRKFDYSRGNTHNLGASWTSETVALNKKTSGLKDHWKTNREGHLTTGLCTFGLVTKAVGVSVWVRLYPFSQLEVHKTVHSMYTQLMHSNA